MKPEKNFDGDSQENLRMENELRKIKLMFEHGADFFYPDNESNIPPEVEDLFLRNIEQFENARKVDKLISVFDFIGKPEFKGIDDIPEKEMGEEYENLVELLFEKGLQVFTICDVEERELYRFITEEFFNHEIENVSIEGMIHCFTYEDFHPNHEYDIKQNASNFITSFLNVKDECYHLNMSKEAMNNSFFKNFRESFRSFSLEHFSISNVTINQKAASLDFIIKFSAFPEGSNEVQLFHGKGNMEFTICFDCWCVDSIMFPVPL